MLTNERIDLIFEGIDTHATVSFYNKSNKLFIGNIKWKTNIINKQCF